MDYIRYLRAKIGHDPIIMIVAGIVIFDASGRILLQRRADTGEWGLNGGHMELGESVEDAARREVLEETGLTVGELELFGVFSEPVKTLKNGDQVQIVHITYTSSDVQGELKAQAGEVLELAHFDLKQLPADLFASHLPMIEAVKTKFA